MSKWLKANGKPIMDSHGHPYDCPTCPCHAPVPTECSQAVDDAVTAYLAEIDPETLQHTWMLYGAYEAPYQCAEWAYDDSDSDGVMEWRLVHPASGYLLIALRKGQIVTDTTGDYVYKLVYAKTIYKPATGEVKTIGCECRTVNYECKHRKVELDDYMIAGELRVLDPDQSDSDYPVSYVCDVDSCELLKLKLETAHSWHGGTLMGEGYYDWLTDPETWSYDGRNHEAFKMAVKWEVETSESESTSTEPIYNLTYIDCDCTSIHTVTLTKGMTCMEYAGFCDLEDPCIDLMMLHNKANYFGWIWHEEGVLVHLENVVYGGTAYIADWYAWRDWEWSNGWNGYNESSALNRKYLACAETTEGYWLIDCSCHAVGDMVYKIKDNSLPASETNPANFRMYLDMDGVCSCNYPDREIILTYPDVFGILETCYGNHAKFDYTIDTPAEGPDSSPTHTEGCDIFGHDYEPHTGHGGRTLYIDYRTLCVTSKALWRNEQKVRVRALYPEGSSGAPTDNWGHTLLIAPPTAIISDHSYGHFDTATIRGDYLIPFTDDPDIGYTSTSGGYTWHNTAPFIFSGYSYTWENSVGSPSEEGAKINGCQPQEQCTDWGEDWRYTQQQVEEMAGCDDTTPTPCISISSTTSHTFRYAALTTPDFTVAMQNNCSVRLDHNPNDWFERRWCWLRKWYTIGAEIGECAWYLLNICYIYTNKGLIVKGLDGYHETYTLLGASNYPEYTGCWSEECKNPRIDPISGEISDPCHWLDEVIECPADNDMHSCFEGFDWGDESDSDSESESSSSN